MADEVARGDANNYRVMQGVTNDASKNTKMVRLDPTTLGLLVAGTVATSGYSTVTSGTATCSSTATAAGVVGVATPCKAVAITVPIANTGTQVSVGGSTAIAVSGSEQGHILIKGSSQVFYITDASNLFWIADTVNDKISYNIFN